MSDLSARIANLSPEQRALFERLREQQKKTAAPRGLQPPPIPRRGPGASWPLSFDQERLWFLYSLDPLDTAYNIDSASRIRGRLDLAALSRAFQEIPRRHESWRTSFRVVAGQPAQVVAPEIVLPFPLVDLRALPAALREPTAHRLMVQEVRRPCVLESGPLARSLLLRLDDDDWICQLTVHHIVTDWVTFQLFWYELGVLYAAFAAGRPSPLPEVAIQYADFAVWQRSWMQGEVLETYRSYWLERLAGVPLVLDLPTDRPRPAVQTSRGGRVAVLVERAAELKSLARREGLTPFMAVLAVYQALLCHHAGQETVIVGSPNANRNRQEIERTFGFFLTQLAFCTDLGGDPTLREVLRRVRDVALGAYAHQELPFGKLVEALQPERDLSRAPIIQVVLLLLDGSVLDQKLADLDLQPIDIHDGNARYDVMFAMWDQPQRIVGWYEYNSDLWDAATAHRMTEGFALLIAALIADPDRPLSAVAVMPAAARHQLLVEWNDTTAPADPPTALDLFAARAAERPAAPALVHGERVVSYGELEQIADRLAARLREIGIGPGSRVGVCVERSPEMVAALLAVWKTAAAYVPLDPAHPAERRDFVLADSGAAALVAGEGNGGVEITPLAPGLAVAPKPAVARPLPGAPAYAIYTSGSTGRPKGVEVPHSALTNLLHALAPCYAAGADVSDTADTVWMAVTTIAFDIAALEIFLPLTTGARVALADRDTAGDGELLARALVASGATHLQATPATWRQLLDSGWSGRPGLRRLCGGEALSRDLAERLLALDGSVDRAMPLWNQYGPTETTIWSAVQRVEPDGRSTAAVPLGRPLRNTRAYVLDRELRPAPLGATGELFLAGSGVASGYLGRPGLTAERFLPDPFMGELGGRLYRTGDLVRWLPDGVLDFLGRADHQVKLRGFRIELGEIEASLRRHPAVADAAVLLRDVKAGDSRLTAWVVPADAAAPPAADELRAALRERLPEYMIPAGFGVLAALPLSPSGKVDRKALMRLEPAVSAAGAAPAPGIAPRSPAEELLAAIWAEVLGTGAPGSESSGGPAIGIGDDFFARGGHSLLATQLVLRIRDAFGVDLPVRAVFQAPTVAAQAELIARLRGAAAAPAASRPIRSLPRPSRPAHRLSPFRAPLSFAQERLWFLDRLTPGSAAYTMPLALRVRGDLDPSALERAFTELVCRHETLRTTFAEEAGRPQQVIAAPAGWILPVEDLAASSAGAEEEARRRASADAAVAFDLERGPLLRTRLLRLGPAAHVLLLAMHHIVSDLWSLGVLVRELGALYAGASLPALPVQYADFAAWQREELQGAELERQIAFWRQRLAGAPPELDLPTDRPRPAAASARGASLPFTAGVATTRALEDLGRRAGATLFMTLTAALASLLARLAGQDDLVLGSPIANRQRPEVAGLIGMFVNTLALRVDLRAGASDGGQPVSFAALLARVRDAALDAYAHQDVPFEKLVEALQPRRDPSRHPLFQVVLAMQNVPLGAIELPGLTLEPLEVESATTKFDLTLTLHATDGSLSGQLEYAADLFDRATIERIAAALHHLLAAAGAAPGTPFRELPLLAPEEQRQALVGWNRTAAEVPPGALHELFAAQAAATPEAIAVVHGEAAMTYGELARRSDRLARRLLALGVGREERIGLCAGRSPSSLVALLGILKAGGAYLPLDPSYPAVRLAWMLDDAGARVLLAEWRLPDERMSELLPALREDLRVVWLQDLEAGGAPPLLPLPDVPAASLAYVMYTSGSTGVPKGVAVTHRNVIRLVRGADYAELGPRETWLQCAPISFDASTLEIWAPLLNGGRLALVPGERASLDELGEAIGRYGVTSLWLTAGLFHQMVDHRLEALRPLGQLLAGGDVVSPDHARRVLEALPGLTLIDGYGPTEGTTFTTCHRLTDPGQVQGRVPIGRPIANARVYVLDAALQPVPPGLAGELFAAGGGLARGYLGRPDLTAERFLPDPFAELPGERVYRTGDRARWGLASSGERTLEILGRMDHDDGQVKIRGFRVEVGEVEAALAAHPAVRQAAVAVRASREAEGRSRELVACLVPAQPEEPVPASELQRFLRARLPAPMIPTACILVAALPLTPNGKVDRRALAELVAQGVGEIRAAAEYLAPRTPLEERLVAACAEVLGLDRDSVGVRDNFFALGGHSLLAMQLVARLRQWSIDVPLQLLFAAANLADVASAITERALSDLDPALLQVGEESS